MSEYFTDRPLDDMIEGVLTSLSEDPLCVHLMAPKTGRPSITELELTEKPVADQREQMQHNVIGGASR
eukprot:2907686-Amphidinium_carterae.1